MSFYSEIFLYSRLHRIHMYSTLRLYLIYLDYEFQMLKAIFLFVQSFLLRYKADVHKNVLLTTCKID